jgi:hypothetical protein
MPPKGIESLISVPGVLPIAPNERRGLGQAALSCRVSHV